MAFVRLPAKQTAHTYIPLPAAACRKYGLFQYNVRKWQVQVLDLCAALCVNCRLQKSLKSGTGRIPEPKKEKHMGTYKSLEEAQEVFKGDR